MRIVILAMKGMLFAFFRPRNQDFVNELYQHEQARHNQRHYGIGDGPGALPPGKYLK